MFGQVLDKLNSWYGRSFLLAWYFPWLLFFTANLLLAAVEFPRARAFLFAEYGRVASSDKVIDVFLALGAVAIVAYTISPAIQPITRLLEGQNLWRWIAEPLLLGHAQRVRSLAMRSEEIFLDRAGLPKSEAITLRLAEIREAGALRRAVTDTDAIDAAETEIEKLQALRYLNRPIGNHDLNVTIQVLSEALRLNCADLIELKLDPPLSQESYDYAVKLDRLHRLMTGVLAPYAVDVAQRREARAYEIREKLFASAELAPTRLGNDVAALRSYCETRYSFDFDFFWPRLQLVMKDQGIAEKLAVAKIQVDFSILSLTLSVLFTVIWLLVLGWRGTSFTSLMIVVVFGPAAIGLWLWMVHESYSAFAELVRGAIDVCRFDLLGALRLPLPATTKAEKAVWQQTVRLLSLGENDEDDVTFKHPSPP
jgi:hypothetical protein